VVGARWLVWSLQVDGCSYRVRWWEPGWRGERSQWSMWPRFWCTGMRGRSLGEIAESLAVDRNPVRKYAARR